MNDRLDILRAKYLESVATREAEIRQFRDKLKLLDELDADVQKIGSASQANGKPKYEGQKLTKSLLDAVQTIGINGRGIPATEARKYIAANGYRHPNPKNFPVATVIALTRLAEQEKIRSEKTGDGTRLFYAKR